MYINIFVHYLAFFENLKYVQTFYFCFFTEEILKSNRAIWWSPDGNMLCFATFNDSKVGTYFYNWYGSHNDSTNVMAQLRSVRYPKVRLNCLYFFCNERFGLQYIKFKKYFCMEFQFNLQNYINYDFLPK